MTPVANLVINLQLHFARKPEAEMDTSYYIYLLFFNILLGRTAKKRSTYCVRLVKSAV